MNSWTLISCINRNSTVKFIRSKARTDKRFMFGFMCNQIITIRLISTVENTDISENRGRKSRWNFVTLTVQSITYCGIILFYVYFIWCVFFVGKSPVSIWKFFFIGYARKTHCVGHSKLSIGTRGVFFPAEFEIINVLAVEIWFCDANLCEFSCVF